jgi:LysM repeat protein
MKYWLISILIALVFFLTVFSPVQADCSDSTYTVRAGDTLASIAEECGINYVVLGNINYEISDPDLIRPGQVIRLIAEEPIPAYETPVTAPVREGGLQPSGDYLVRKGDSLGKIAYLYHTTIDDLYGANPQLGNRPVVFPGQTIHLPWDASREKGFIGVSRLTAYPYDEIRVRLIDFPPNTKVDFSLVYLRMADDSEEEDDYWPGIGDLDDEDLMTASGQTDARGETRVTLKMPYWAYEGEIWAVLVTMPDNPSFQRYSQDIAIGE